MRVNNKIMCIAQWFLTPNHYTGSFSPYVASNSNLTCLVMNAKQLLSLARPIGPTSNLGHDWYISLPILLVDIGL